MHVRLASLRVKMIVAAETNPTSKTTAPPIARLGWWRLSSSTPGAREK
jgi:hypothetical protein